MHMQAVSSLAPTADSCVQARYDLPHAVAGASDPRRHWTLATAALALLLSIDAAVRVGSNASGANRGVASPLVAWWVVMRWKMAAL